MTLHLELSEANRSKFLRHLKWLTEVGLIERFALDEGTKTAAEKLAFAALNGKSARSALAGYVQQELASLPENWDGYGAVPIEPKVVEKTLDLLRILPETAIRALNENAILPNPNGTISMIWEKENDSELFLEIGENFATYYFKKEGKLIELNNHFQWQPGALPIELAQHLDTFLS